MENVERVVSAESARALARKVNFERTVLTYILWDETGEDPSPIYVGTAKSKDRIYNHARKAHGGTSLTRKSRNFAFAEHVERQAKKYGPDWLGFSFHQHNSFESAKIKETSLIRDWGLRKYGGKLFNRRLAG